MRLVGLTGGIGCGKTTVAAEFERLGVPCFVADRAGAACYDDSHFRNQVEKILGPAVIGLSGEIDRHAVADIVFADREKMEQLNALVHPRVMAAFAEWCKEQKAPYVLLESAILYEYGLDKYMDDVVAVYVGMGVRIERLRVRDNVTEKQLMPRILAQMPAEEKMMRADYVVLNYEGNPRRQQVEYIHRQIMNKIPK